MEAEKLHASSTCDTSVIANQHFDADDEWDEERTYYFNNRLHPCA